MPILCFQNKITMATAPVPAPAPAASGATTAKSSAKTKTVTKAGGGTKAKKPARKKPTKKGTAATNQATLKAARSAQMDLASQRNKAAARRSDPLWFRDEDVLPFTAEESPMAENGKILPEQVQIVENALSHNNLSRSDVTPQAFYCLMEQARRFAFEIITDSQDYAFVANRNEISKADLELANSFRPDHPIALSAQLPKLHLLAQQINRVPLPPIPTQCYSGVLLPPKAHQLTARTFDVVSGAQVANKMVQQTPSLPSRRSSSKPKPSYGASRGRQISITLQKKEATAPAAPTTAAPTTAAPTTAAPAAPSASPTPPTPATTTPPPVNPEGATTTATTATVPPTTDVPPPTS